MQAAISKEHEMSKYLKLKINSRNKNTWQAKTASV